jgi:TPR repeat protein
LNAIKWIASRHYHGLNGFDRDLPRAAEYFRQAADAGDAEARYNYAVMRLTGQDGGPADPALAHTYFQEAAAHDFPPALNGLGLRVMGGDYTGRGEPPNYESAFQYFLRSAHQNSADGHYNLAALFKDGKGVKKNVPVALMHFAVAAALGQHRAQWMLGDALHSRSSFLSAWLGELWSAEGTYRPDIGMSREEQFRLRLSGAWSSAKKGINITANVSLSEGVHVQVWDMHRGRETTLAFPIDQISCSHAVKFFRPLAETRAAGSAYRMGVKSWIEGDSAEAERLFQASSWMGLAAGTSNAAWLLRQQHPGQSPPPPELLLLGGAPPGGEGGHRSLGGVDCGAHRAASCAVCPQGHGVAWCNGECSWDEEEQRCYRPDQDPEDPELPAAETEVAAGEGEEEEEGHGNGNGGFLSTIIPGTMSIAAELQQENARVAAGASRLYAWTAAREGEGVARAVNPDNDKYFVVANQGVSLRDDHAFAYSVQAAVQGDVLEHVVVAAAIYRQVASFCEEGELGVASLARKDAVRAWQGAVASGSPEASSEFGLMFVTGNPLLEITQNYTRALEYLGSCGGPGVMDQGIGGRPVPLECVPSQLLMWYVRGRQSRGVGAVFRTVQGLSAKFGEEKVATGLLVAVCMVFMLVGCFL